VDDTGVTGSSSDRGLVGFLDDHPGDPDEPVVHQLDRSTTLRELREAAARVAAALGSAGVVSGQPVAVVVDSGVSTLAAMFGVWAAGAVFVPINGRLTDTEVRSALAASSPAVIVGRQRDNVGYADRWLVEDTPLTWTSATADPTVAAVATTDAALIMRTSGTTGTAKPIVLTHTGVRDGIDTVLGSLRSTRRTDDAPRRTPMANLIPSSLALWAGIWNGLFALRVGAPLVLMDRFDTGDFATLVRRHQIRSTVLAPAMMAMLTEDPAVTDLSPLTMARSITAPLTPQQARAFRAKFGVGVMNCYGQTELGSEVVGWTPADLREFGESKLGAVGRAHKGVELAILDDDHNPVAPDSVAEVWVRSPFASTAPEIAARLVDGYLRTGDLGRLDDDGFLWLEGRVSDVINRGGLKVLPQEIEDVLRTLPDVADACVAGVSDTRLGEVPVAWVRPLPGRSPDPAVLLAATREVLAGYKVPTQITIVEDFPRNEIGKVLRGELVKQHDLSAPQVAGATPPADKSAAERP
jgi:long-chain acyl-CoA synthetase